MLLLHHRSCCCYHKGTYFQANHNRSSTKVFLKSVVVATTKVRIFKQITTVNQFSRNWLRLLLLPQRYVFSSKSQPYPCNMRKVHRCCCYHKGTYFQANHNTPKPKPAAPPVVVATTKVRIFKQITTNVGILIPLICCCCYHKGTYFQANHNR